jgi:hypothetical protein
MSKKEEIERYKKKIKEITSSKNIIPGIHNYCDRWCERCAYVSRCSVGIAEFETDGPEHDLHNKEFWEQLSMIFQATMEMITDKARELGIDLSEASTKYEKPEHHETEAEKLAKEYGFRLHNWLKSNRDLFAGKADNFALIGKQHMVSFSDAVDVVSWYSLFISVKIHRATLTPYSFDEEETDNYDKNGSAKIALIAVSRSLEAFSFLYNNFPEKEDDILRFLADLARIQKLLQKAFPDAMKFRRPGFDENV